MDTQRQTIRGITFRGQTPINLTGTVTLDGGLVLQGKASSVGELSFEVPIDRKGNGGNPLLTCDGMTEPWGAGIRVITSTLDMDGAEMNVIQPIEMGPSAVPFPQGVVARGPLPPFPEPIDYDDTLWFQPPAGAEPRYWRCNFGTVTIPGLPFVPGMEPTNYDRLLTGFFGRYSSDWQATIIDTYRGRGYTHFLRWVQDEQNYPCYSIEKYVNECLALKAGGVPFIVHSFLSKDYAPFNPSVQYLRDTFGPLIDALQAAHCLDICIVGFELNLVSDGNLFDLVDYFAVERGLTEANGCPNYVHFISGYTWPGPVGGVPDRAQWWNAQHGKLTGLCYQNDPAWAIKDAQDRYKDTTDNSNEGFVGRDSGFGHDYDFISLETKLAEAFGHDLPDENDLDLFGYLSLCTDGGVPVRGFGCGARRPDGSYL